MTAGIQQALKRAIGSRVATVTAALTMALAATGMAAEANDAVMEWNQIALAATVTAGQGAVPQIRSMTIVQVSVHDAVNGISGAYDTYLQRRLRGGNASAEAAAIAAAHHALVALFPAQAPALNAVRAASLAARGLSTSDPGVAFGESIAAEIVALRANDGSAQAQFTYSPPTSGMAGGWTLVGSAPALLPGWGSVMPWVLPSGSRFRIDGPPALRSSRYARDFDEVKAIGSATSTTRTAEQTEIARFWLASPAVIWNSVARGVLERRRLDLSSTARTLGLMYLAAADASIVCWQTKYTVNFWRPLTAIQQADADDNTQTIADPTWAPLFPTPQHPEFLSGHATNSAAMAAALRAVFGDSPGVPIVASSSTNPALERRWKSFGEGVAEVIDARVYSGIHFRSTDEVSAEVGRDIARLVIIRHLRARR
jgi:hypothetical protein